MVYFASENREEVCASYERDGKPVVHLNPASPTATENFVSPDYFGASRSLGQAWRETGRRRWLLLVYQSLKNSVSAQLRFAGLVNAIGADLNETISLRVRELDDNRAEYGHQMMQRMLTESKDVP